MDEGFDCRSKNRPQASRNEAVGRSEIASFLEEIGSRTPSPLEVVEAVRRVAASELSPCRLDEILAHDPRPLPVAVIDLDQPSSRYLDLEPASTDASPPSLDLWAGRLRRFRAALGPAGWRRRGTLMRIRSKVALVGLIPIAVAAAIAVSAWLLLDAAERAKNGAVMAGAVYADLQEVTTARNEYLRARPQARALEASRLTEASVRGLNRLETLTKLARNPGHRALAEETAQALNHYRDRMWDLMQITIRNDRLIAEMGARAAKLSELTERARARQRASNADIVASLTESDRRLRFARDIVDRAQEMRAALAAVALQEALAQNRDRPATQSDLERSFGAVRLRNSARDLAQLLREDGRGEEAAQLQGFMRRFDGATGAGPAVQAEGEDSDGPLRPKITDWVDRLITVISTEQRAIHEEVAQLLTYSVNAAETEQATQNIAVTNLKLEARARDAFGARDAGATDEILKQTESLAEIRRGPADLASDPARNGRRHQGLARRSRDDRQRPARAERHPRPTWTPWRRA